MRLMAHRLLRGLRPTRAHQPASGLPAAVLAARRVGRPRMVPPFTTQSISQGGAQLYSGSIATPTPQTFSVASSPEQEPGFGVDPPSADSTSRTAHWPVSTRFEPARCLRSFNHWFALATPSDLARRTRTVR